VVLNVDRWITIAQPEVKMNIISKILFTIIIVLVIKPIVLYSQSFEKNILIDIPGDNYDFDLLASDTYPGHESFITWINKNDTTYTVFLKKISPEISDNLVISSNKIIKSNSRVAVNNYTQGIKIVWQNYANGYYQIVGCNYFNDTLENEIIVQDSISNDPQISLSAHRIAWIDAGDLFVREFYPYLSDKILFDSLNCLNPELIKNDTHQETRILYEKHYTDSVKVNMISYQHNENTQPIFWHDWLSKGPISKNPKFGMNEEISFQTYENGIWKSEYNEIYYWEWNWKKTKNENCNYNNSILFSYPIPTSFSPDLTPFFLAFDSDSIFTNNEIFIKTFYYDLYDSLINISNMEGNDYEPKVAYVVYNDTVYVAIIWLHQNNYKTNIWIAKEAFQPIYTSVKDEYINIKSFDLLQNYPNPFNPITKIEYFLEEDAKVEVIIFDILGNHIITLVNEFEISGKHKVIFDANNLSSGIYFYSVKVKGIQKTKTMVLLR
jgi:hypothetical protein